jgi:hypothetical protein
MLVEEIHSELGEFIISDSRTPLSLLFLIALSASEVSAAFRGVRRRNAHNEAIHLLRLTFACLQG